VRGDRKYGKRAETTMFARGGATLVLALCFSA
jgi:hypothetical protein